MLAAKITRRRVFVQEQETLGRAFRRPSKELTIVRIAIRGWTARERRDRERNARAALIVLRISREQRDRLSVRMYGWTACLFFKKSQTIILIV